MKPADPYLFDTKEASEFLGVHPNTLIRMRKEEQSRGPAFTPIGLRFFYHYSDLIAWQRKQHQLRAQTHRESRTSATPEIPDHLDHDAAAGYIGGTPGQLYTLRYRGEAPPFVKKGRWSYYHLDALDAWKARSNVSGQTRRSVGT